MELTFTSVRLPVALDADTVACLARDLAAAWASPAPVVALINAEPDVFCTGLALDASPEAAGATSDFASLLAAMHAAPKPLMAIADGAVIGGGLGLACACDWVIATPRSTFALPELLWGLVPAIIWPVVGDRMSPHVARQWTIAAHARSATEALAAGVLDELVDASQLTAASTRSARKLARLEPGALASLRAWARTSRTLSLPDAVAQGAALTASRLSTTIVQHRWLAYKEGRAPWSA